MTCLRQNIGTQQTQKVIISLLLLLLLFSSFFSSEISRYKPSLVYYLECGMNGWMEIVKNNSPNKFDVWRGIDCVIFIDVVEA